MSGLGIDWSSAVGATVFAAVLAVGWGWRRIRRFVRRRLRRASKGRRPSHRFRDRQASAIGARRISPVRANDRADISPIVLTRFRVVDGDTLRNLLSGVVYRLENIDSPETEDRAKCYRERRHGERAKVEALRILQAAVRIEVRPTGEIDKYGRTIAFIDVDGQDFGELMIERGLARPWKGQPQVWCGPEGGLALMARTCSMEFACKTCGANTVGKQIVDLAS